MLPRISPYDFATKHPDVKFKKAYRTKSRKSTDDNRDVVVEDIGKGLMVLLTSHDARAILVGVGEVLGG